MTRILTLSMAAAAVVVAQANCPYAVPSTLEMFVSRTLPPGPHPYVRATAWVSVFCDSAPAGQGAAIHVSTDSPLLFHAGSPFNARSTSFDTLAYPQSDLSYRLPTISINFIGTELNPDAGTRSYSVTIAVQGGASVSLPVNVTFTDAPFIGSSTSMIVFALPQGATPPEIDAQIGDEYFWLCNTTSPLSMTVTAQSAGWFSVNPTGGTGYSMIQARGDPGSRAPSMYWGSLIVTVPGAANSPLMIPAQLIVQPRT